jgi:hypothetical protein
VAAPVDIAIVNDEPVRSDRREAYELTLLRASLQGPLRPGRGPFVPAFEQPLGLSQ